MSKTRTVTSLYRIPPSLAAPLVEVLRGYVQATAMRQLAADLALSVLVCGGFVSSCLLLDRFVDIAGRWRAPLPLLGAVLLLGLVFRMLRRLARRPDYDQAARTLDRASGDRRDHLRSALDFAAVGGRANFFVEASQRTAVRLWRSGSYGPYVKNRAASRLTCAAAMFAVAAVALWQIPSLRTGLLWQRFIDPTGNHMRPSATWFVIEPLPAGPLRSGDDLEVRTRLAGRKTASPMPLLKVMNADGTSITRRLASTGDGRWAVVLNNLRQDFDWTLLMRHARSERYAARVLPRPTVARATVSYEYPKYARMPNRTERLKGRTITALQGTKIRLKIESNVNLAGAVGSVEQETIRFRVSRRKPTEAIVHLIVGKKQKLALDLVSEDGVTSLQEAPFTIRPIADNVPSISIKSDLDGQSFYLTDVLQIDYRAQDDLGISELVLRAEVPRQQHATAVPKLIDVDLQNYGDRLAEGRLRLPVADLLPVNTNQLRLSMVARDTRNQEGASPSVTLKIATDSFDRQLRFLLKSYTGKPLSIKPDRGEPSLAKHEKLLEALKATRAGLAILIDSLDEHQPVGENQAELLKRIQTELKRIRPSPTYGTWWFFDFQNAALPARFRRLGEHTIVWSRLGIDSGGLEKRFDQALPSANPRAGLQALVPLVDQAIEEQTRIAARVRADYRLIVNELVGYLASDLINQLAGADEADWADPGYVSNRLEALKEIAGRIKTDLAGTGQQQRLTALDTALSADDYRTHLIAVVPDLQEIKQQCAQQARDAVRQRLNEQSVLRRDLLAAHRLGPAAVSLLATGLYLGGDNILEDDLFLLQSAFRFLHIYLEKPGSFQPLGDPDAQVRRRDAAIFDLYGALERARAKMEQVRLGLVSETLRYGQPELDAEWLGLRERRVALIESIESTDALAHVPVSYRQQIEQFIADLAILDSWHVPAGVGASRLADDLARWERAGTTLSTALLPEVRALLAKLVRDLAARHNELVAAIEQLGRDLGNEIAALETALDRRIAGAEAIKLRLKGVQAALLKALDFAQLARIHHAGDQVELEPLVKVHLLLSKLIQEFEGKIEATAKHAIHHFKDQASVARGMVHEYRQLEGILRSLGQFLASGEAEMIDALIRSQHLSDQHDRQQAAIRGALSAQGRLNDRKRLLADLASDADDPSAVWAEIFYRLSMIRRALGAQANAAALDRQINQLITMLDAFDQLPDDLGGVREVLTEIRSLSLPTLEQRNDLLQQTDALIDALRPLARPRQQHITQYVREFYNYFQTIEIGALIRAKIRSRRQLDRDRQMVKRALATAALEPAAMPPANLKWALGEAELNRRKAGLALDQVGLGGIALTGDGMDNLKLPRHLYLELKRARAGAMPPLFRQQSYDYLNRILQNAR